MQNAIDLSPKSPYNPHACCFEGNLETGVYAAAKNSVYMVQMKPGRKVQFFIRLPGLLGDLYNLPGLTTDICKYEGPSDAESRHDTVLVAGQCQA
jgi:hypothetical protein